MYIACLVLTILIVLVLFLSYTTKAHSVTKTVITSSSNCPIYGMQVGLKNQEVHFIYLGTRMFTAFFKTLLYNLHSPSPLQNAVYS